ncbi:MAG: hypothetical protein IJP31_06680 [Lachnospiraceae bacterium]|nr:hypothetical protein [Lachnospiraceae bacterium]
MKKKMIRILAAALAGSMLAGCGSGNSLFKSAGQAESVLAGEVTTGRSLDKESEGMDKEPLNLELNIEDYYTTKTGFFANFYYIDENKVLWGSGYNDYGQLGQGTQDDHFYEEPVKIAENVVHVDYSEKGFVIYLTADHKLYGIGNTACGALMSYGEFDLNTYMNPHKNCELTPKLLLEEVIFARCGKEDVACMKEDSSVWIFGTIAYDARMGYYYSQPRKVLENAVLITGGWFNHAALLQDGTVWTWGYNLTGNCGVEGKRLVLEPEKVAEDVTFVWTGKFDQNVDFDHISEAPEINEGYFENTIIQKSDGSLWICGNQVGRRVKIIIPYYELSEYITICTHEFWPFKDEIGDKVR